MYSDRFSVFETSRKRDSLTQFQRALNQLEIELVLASSPQAKGRVERANRTLQDRLVQELKLRKITTIEEANRFLPEFVEAFNRKYSKEPVSSFDAHRPLEPDHDLDRILCRYGERTLTKDLTFQYCSRHYKIEGIPEIRRARGRKVEVRKTMSGKMRVFLGGKELRFKPLEEVMETRVLSGKERLFWKPTVRKPQPKDHPWKKYGYQIALAKKVKEREMEKVI